MLTNCIPFHSSHFPAHKSRSCPKEAPSVFSFVGILNNHIQPPLLGYKAVFSSDQR